MAVAAPGSAQLKWGTVSAPSGPRPYRIIDAGTGSPLAAPADRPSVVPPPLSQQQPPSEPIAPFLKAVRPWPSPSLNPGVPSAFIANWGDLFAGVAGGTAGNLRPDVDGSWAAGFGLGDAARLAALEFGGGCGSFKRFCGNGGLAARVSRIVVNQPRSRVAIAAGWQNFVQWGYEGRQDNLVYGAVSYAVPLRSPRSGFAQTLQFNAGVGNSTLAPYTETDSERAIGGFASLGVELSPGFGVSAGWSGRGVNAMASYSPFRTVPITLNVLGADLLNETPAGTVAVFTVGIGGNFATPNFVPASPLAPDF